MRVDVSVLIGLVGIHMIYVGLVYATDSHWSQEKVCLDAKTVISTNPVSQVFRDMCHYNFTVQTFDYCRIAYVDPDCESSMKEIRERCIESKSLFQAEVGEKGKCHYNFTTPLYTVVTPYFHPIVSLLYGFLVIGCLLVLCLLFAGGSIGHGFVAAPILVGYIFLLSPPTR